MRLYTVGYKDSKPCYVVGVTHAVAALKQDDKQLQEGGLHLICTCLSTDCDVARPNLLQAGALQAAAGLMQSDVPDIQVSIYICRDCSA
jgi:hypothetical protein